MTEGWLFHIVIAVFLILWALFRHRQFRALLEAKPSPDSATDGPKNGINSARGPLVLVAETVPELSPTPAETEQDQIEITVPSLEAELAESTTLIDRLRARLNSKDVKIGRLQLQLMESPTRGVLESGIATRDTEIKLLEQQLETERVDYINALRAHQQDLERIKRRDALHASTIMSLEDTFNAKIRTMRDQHQINVQQLKMRYSVRLNETDQRAGLAHTLKIQALSRCEELEAQIPGLQTSHAELTARGLVREQERKHFLDKNQSTQESESSPRNCDKVLDISIFSQEDNLNTLRELVKTRDQNVEDLETAVAVRVQQVEKAKDVVNTHTETIIDLERQIADRDKDVRGLQQMVDTRVKHIELLQQTAASRNESIGALKNLVSIGDKNMEDLRRRMTEQKDRPEQDMKYAREAGRLEAVATLQVETSGNSKSTQEGETSMEDETELQPGDLQGRRGTQIQQSQSSTNSLRNDDMANEKAPREASNSKERITDTGLQPTKKSDDLEEVKSTSDVSVEKDNSRPSNSLRTSKWATAVDTRATAPAKAGGIKKSGRQDAKQGSAQMPQRLADFQKSRPRTKEAGEITSSQETARTYENGNGKKGNRSKQDCPEVWPAQPEKAGGPPQTMLTMQQVVAKDDRRASGTFSQWLLEKQKQINEEVQQEEADKIANLRENVRKHEEARGEMDDRDPQK